MLADKMVKNKLINLAAALLMRPEDDQEIQMLEGTGRKVKVDLVVNNYDQPDLKKII